MLLNCSVAAGGNRALKSLVTSKNAPSTTSWAATSLTRRNMLRSCVLVSRRILCGATTCSGSDASHSGVGVGGGSTTDGMPPPQAINRVAQNTIAARAPSHLPGRIAYLLRLIARVTPGAGGGSAICLTDFKHQRGGFSPPGDVAQAIRRIRGGRLLARQVYWKAT